MKPTIKRVHFFSLCECTTIAVHTGVLAKNHIWPVATRKKRIGEQLNYIGKCVLNPLHRQKRKENFFSDGRSRGPLLAKAALNQHARRYTTTEKLPFLLNRVCIPNTVIHSCQNRYNSYS